ncbi:recombination mediator RecR [Alphaproteobacteria bacterium]|nr:recombination mediator RecR [Alphaproteobacteria bacterium]
MKSNEIDILIQLLSNLQGVGPRSARRIILQLIKNNNNLMKPLAETLNVLSNKVKICNNCGNYCIDDCCDICSNNKRDRSLLCIVEEVADLWAIERGKIFNGLYFVLGGTLNAIKGITPEKLNINKLFEKLKNKEIKEVILATSITTSGQTTAHYLLNNIKKLDIKVTRLARGVPAGGELDYLDEATLGQALNDRTLVFNGL